MRSPGSWKVSAVARGDHGDAAQGELFELAEGEKKSWTLADWNALLARLDGSRLTMDQFRNSQKEFL